MIRLLSIFWLLFCCLASATLSCGSLAGLNHEALANRWGHTLHGHGHIHDPMGQRANITPHLRLTTSSLGVSLPSSVSLLWDSNGSLTNDGTRSFFFDAENQLTNVTVVGAWKSEFVYDGLGRRRIQRDYGWQSGQWVRTNETRLVYDGYLVIQERDSNNVPLVTYTRGLDLVGDLQAGGGIGGLLARTDGSGSTFYHTDGAGNITALMDAQENMAARYLYGPFGRLTGQWGPMAGANAMQFSSMPRHANSGLSLYPFRGYDATLQRFLNRDPIGELGEINLYRFNFNNPLRYMDPFGLMEFHWYNPLSWYWPGYGGPTYSPPLPLPNPDTFGARHGIDTDWMGGMKPGDFVAANAIQVAKDSAMAMAMLTPLGEEEGAAEAGGGLWNWLKGAWNKCRNLRGAAKALPQLTKLKNADVVVGLVKDGKIISQFQYGRTLRSQ